MILNNAPQHEAVLSNVGEIGEFRIRNSAKAFNILSSGLYANKIRAIIRELSCNAVDSHVAAGRADVPFDVHLPNTIDPTFRIRDYGTGLSHDQVLNIYTTYFESTKTESNQFIGALGLGSKSPFSYTDNFTVTAIKDGTRNVYSAFINGEGVPSVALMHSESTDESAGVEVQFAVTDRWDFDKFRSEARDVYTYFALRPVVNGGDREFSFRDIEYKDKNIIPGVHYTGRGPSRAVMGNISYPIDVPNADSNLGPLANLLGCGLEMHFAIGELDFQASREGLSYIPQTIRTIRDKLEALNTQLAVHLDLEVNTIKNAWEKVYFLLSKSHETLWAEATRSYLRVNPVPMVDFTSNHYVRPQNQCIEIKELAARYNVAIHAFYKSRNSASCSEIKPNKEFKDHSHATFEEKWNFTVDTGTVFVKNDLKTGALTRAKYHWRHAASKNIELPGKSYSNNVYVLTAATKGHAMDVDGFFAAINNPPASQIVTASSLIEKERKVASTNRAKNVRIMRLTEKNYHRRYENIVWDEIGSADQLDATQTYYYIPLSGYTPVDVKQDPKDLFQWIRTCGVKSLHGVEIYGVRKGDIEWVREQKNWVLLETRIADVLGNVSADALASLACNELDSNKLFGYNKDIVMHLVRADSPYLLFVNKLKDVEHVSNFRSHNLNKLLQTYAPVVDLKTVINSLKDEQAAVQARYPLMQGLPYWSVEMKDVAEYINLIDNTKGN